jgi:hypothetical protein
MSEKEFIKKYNSLQEGKKRTMTISMIYAISSVVIIISCFIWMYAVSISTVDKLKVIDKTGNYVNTSTVRKEKLLKSLIESHCANTVYYANSFDRLTIKENQAKTLFLMNQKDAKKIFETYLKNNNYNDAIQRSYDFETTIIKIKELDTTEEPYKVSFISEFKISQGEKIQKYYIISEGEIVSHTPQYPENPNGFFFKSYSQEFKSLDNE